MKYYATAFSGIIAALLISSFVSQAYASDLNAFLIPERNKSEASYIGIKTVELRYPEGSSLAQEFDGKNERVRFTMNVTSGEIISIINRAFANVQSPVQSSSAEISYSARLEGGLTSTRISYRVELKPTMEQYVLATEGSQNIVDLEWRGIVIEEPVVVNAPDVGEIDINHPIGLLHATHPAVAEQLANTQATEVLEDPILNFEDFNEAPMSSWQFLFDPVGSYGGSVELQGTEGAKVLSVYALGESSIREGTHTATEKDVDVTINGAKVQIHSTTPPPSGQITIAGYAEDRENEGAEFAFVSAEAPAGAAATGGFPIQVLLVLGGMMGAVAIFVLLKARK